MMNADTQDMGADKSNKKDSPESSPEMDSESVIQSASELLSSVRDVWRDRIALLIAEYQLTMRSLLLIVILVCCLAGLLAFSWMALVVFLSYCAVVAGGPLWLVFFCALGLQVLMAWYLWSQVKQLTAYMGFPSSRQALFSPTLTAPSDSAGEKATQRKRGNQNRDKAFTEKSA